jgi:Subtilase family
VRLRRSWFAGTALAALVLAGTAFTASTGSVTITTIGGQTVKKGTVSNPVSGNVAVAGRAALAGQDAAPAAKPLVADAGDTPYSPVGQPATLLGAGYGGAEPYTFSWSTTAGTLSGADAPTAQLDAPVGVHTATLAVTDAKGATATDTVKVIVYSTETITLLDKTQLEPTPGVSGVGAPGKVEFPFDVPAGAARIDAKLTYLVGTNDWDLKLYDPAGNERAFPGEFIFPENGAPNTNEEATIHNPEPGTWKAVVEKFATTADQITVKVTALIAAGQATDPRPIVDSGGPYAFATGTEQKLDGNASGGTAPLTVAWDTDQDGVFESSGPDITTNLGEGRHIVSLKATDANGYERRETTSLVVAAPDRLAAESNPVTVIGVADSGINAYHLEFSAQTYPDPEILKLTRNFTAHPSEYIPGYPEDAQAIPITLGEGYYPAKDKPVWASVEKGRLHWIPGTKIIGAWDTGISSCANCAPDLHAVLDDDGHGSGSASVSAGNRYGYCPTCLLFVVEALDESIVNIRNYVDISTNSFGTVGGIPTGLASGGTQSARTAVERGQTVLFAAGNGVGNAFDVPQATWGQDSVGPDWVITVGAIRRDNHRAIVGDGIPAHISAWGDGNLPSACRTGTVGQCAFGGTSAATPYTAGVFGTVLTEVRRAIGDVKAGQKPGQVVAQGHPIEESAYLEDGKLTRAELREVVLKTATPLNQRNDVSPFPYPLTAPYLGEANVLFEGYGAATPESAQRAINVLLGKEPLPAREFEDSFFALDRQVRDTIYGGYDRDGDGVRDSEALAGTTITQEQVSTVQGALATFQKVSELTADATTQLNGGNFMRYYLHRRVASTPGVDTCLADDNEQYMDQENTVGDKEPCFENRITTVAAAYRPVGLFASTDTLDAPLPAGSEVIADIYLAGETPSVIRPTGVLMATDRELGEGSGVLQPVLGTGVDGVGCDTLGEACWTKYTFSFETTRHAFRGEQLTFQVKLIGARSWAFGHEGQHASKIAILPGEMPAEGLEFGASITEPANGSEVKQGDVVAGGRYDFPALGADEAGGHPTQKVVEVSVDDASFANVIKATLDSSTNTWSAPLGNLSRGEHTVYARARMDQTLSAVASSTFTVVPDAQVQWQIVSRNRAPSSRAWQPATGLEAWNFNFNTANYEKGWNGIIVRLTQGGEETASTWAFAKFR